MNELIIALLNLFLGLGNYINDEGFRNALYMIDIGQNDLADSFLKNMTYERVIKRIPLVITEIANAVKVSSVFYIYTICKRTPLC